MPFRILYALRVHAARRRAFPWVPAMARQDLLLVFAPVAALIAGLVVFSCIRDSQPLPTVGAQLERIQQVG